MQLQPLRCSPWPHSWNWMVSQVPKIHKQLDTFQQVGKFHHSTVGAPRPNQRIAWRLCTPKKRSKKELSAFASFASWGKLRTQNQAVGDDPWRLKNITYCKIFLSLIHDRRYLYFIHCQWWRFPGLLHFLSNKCFPKPLQFLQVHKSSSSSSEWNFWNLLIKSWMFSLPVFCNREGGEPVIHK